MRPRAKCHPRQKEEYLNVTAIGGLRLPDTASGNRVMHGHTEVLQPFEAAVTYLERETQEDRCFSYN